MTLDQAIKWLTAAKTKHGGDTEVYFDCPKCQVSYTPGRLVTEAIHLAAVVVPPKEK